MIKRSIAFAPSAPATSQTTPGIANIMTLIKLNTIQCYVDG